MFQEFSGIRYIKEKGSLFNKVVGLNFYCVLESPGILIKSRIQQVWKRPQNLFLTGSQITDEGSPELYFRNTKLKMMKAQQSSNNEICCEAVNSAYKIRGYEKFLR